MSYYHEKKGIFLSKKTLPQWDESKIKILDHIDWWDGPLTGYIEYENQTYWFDYIGDCPELEFYLDEDTHECTNDCNNRHYFYGVFPLTEDQIKEWKDNKENPKYLGPDMHGVKMIAWFTDGCNQNFYAIVVHKKDCPKVLNTEGECKCVISKEIK